MTIGGHFPDGLEQIGAGTGFKDDLCDMMEGVSLLRDFSRKDLEVLAGFMQAYQAKPGVRIFTEGTKQNYLCILVKGKLDVRKEVNLKEERHLAVVRPGKSVGEMSLIDELPHSASVISTTDVTLLLLTRLNFDRLRDEYPRLAFDLLLRIAQMTSHRLRQASGQLIDFLSR